MEEKMKTEKITTADLGLCSLLRYLGHSPVNYNNSSGKIYFEFQALPEIKKIVNRYELNLKLEIDPFHLFQTFREVKGIVMRARDVK